MDICVSVLFPALIFAFLFYFANRGGSYGIGLDLKARADRKEKYKQNKSSVDSRRHQIGKLESAVRTIHASSSWSVAPNASEFARATGLLQRAKSKILDDSSKYDISECSELLKSAVVHCHRDLKDRLNQILET